MIEGEWDKGQFKFDQTVKVIIKEIQSGKIISTFEGKVDAKYNPILHHHQDA